LHLSKIILHLLELLIFLQTHCLSSNIFVYSRLNFRMIASVKHLASSVSPKIFLGAATLSSVLVSTALSETVSISSLDDLGASSETINAIGQLPTYQNRTFDGVAQVNTKDATFAVSIDFNAGDSTNNGVIWESGGATIGSTLSYNQAAKTLRVHHSSNGGNALGVVTHQLTDAQVTGGDVEVVWAYDASEIEWELFVDGASSGTTAETTEANSLNNWSGGNAAGLGIFGGNFAAGNGDNTNLAAVANLGTTATINLEKGLRFWAGTDANFPFLVLKENSEITIKDPSFEINSGGDMTPGGWNNGLGPDWEGRDGANAGGAFEEYISGFVADGTDHVGIGTGYYIWQDTGVAIAPNTTYTLTVAAGNRNAGFSSSGNASTYALLAGATNLGAANYANTAAVIGNTSLTLASGSVDAAAFNESSFVDGAPLVFTTGATVPDENLVILLGDNSATGRSHFDNIRLDVRSRLRLASLYESRLGEAVIFNASLGNGLSNDYNYQWSLNGNPIPASEGGNQPKFSINGLAENEGSWKVVISDSEATYAEKTFEYRVFVDTDGDGLSDYREQNLTNTNFEVVDTDEDGLSDGEEVTLGTDPLVADTDEDGFSDYFEANITKTSPTIKTSLRAIESDQIHLQNFSDFNIDGGQTPDGSTVGGERYVPYISGISEDPFLVLTQDGNSGSNYYKLPIIDFLPESFEVKFDLQISGSGGLSDGFSITFGDIPVGSARGEFGYAEPGSLVIGWDTYPNSGEQTSVEVFGSGVSLGNHPHDFNSTKNKWVPVEVNWDNNILEVKYDGDIIFENLITTGFDRTSVKRLAFAATAGGDSQSTYIDNIEVTYYSASTASLNESNANEEAVVDASSGLPGDPSSYIYQWYFEDTLIPTSEGGNEVTYSINGVPQNEGTWKVLISDRETIYERTFEYRIFVDTDGDGLSDYREQNLTNTNFQIVDTDEDGLSDGEEVTLGTDPLVADTDVDGIIDGSEAGFGTDPLVADTDEDGVLDGAENCCRNQPPLL
jgi:hypothetical protein